MLAATKRPVVVEEPKVAMSEALFGTVIGFQFEATFQSLLVGFTLHVALPPKALCEKKSRSVVANRTAARASGIRVRTNRIVSKTAIPREGLWTNIAGTMR
jgi:hypothetical protein